jgi:hypothetical protein
LLEGEPGQDTVMDHLGVEVESTDEVDAASKRLTGEGMETLVENGTTCCYALQDKVWVHGPGREPWEVYAVKDDSAFFGKDSAAAAAGDAGARPEGCCSWRLAAAGSATTVGLPTYSALSWSVTRRLTSARGSCVLDFSNKCSR